MKALELGKQKHDQLIDLAVNETKNWLSNLENIPAAATPVVSQESITYLPENGCGVEKSLRIFIDTHQSQLSGSAGSHYWGYVTGGITPATLIGDWLATDTINVLHNILTLLLLIWNRKRLQCYFISSGCRRT